MTLVTSVLVKLFFIIDSVLASWVNTANLTNSWTNTLSLTAKGESLVQNLASVEAAVADILVQLTLLG